jgi:type II secretory pathway pseudopilin PulG
MTTNKKIRRESGFAMIIGLVIVLVMTAFSTALVFTSAAHHVQAKTATERARALALAEGAATLLLNDMDADHMSPVKDTGNWPLVGTTFTRKFTPFDAGDGTVRAEVTYLVRDAGNFVPVTFDSRVTPVKPYDRVQMVVTAFRPGVERTIEIDLSQEFVLFEGAIVSDAVPTGPSVDPGDGDSGKREAQDGHIVFDAKGNPDQLYVNGSIMSNGDIVDQDGNVLTTENANSSIQFAGSMDSGMAGTPQQIPDYTSIGSQDQLFDFDRFIAAARAGAGREFTSVADFVATMNAYNALGVPLEGITVLNLPSDADDIEREDLPGGINIRGTLLFNFEAGTDPFYKVFVRADCAINAADLTGLVPSDASTYTSGYGLPYDNPALMPSAVDISGGGFENFKSDDDIPALMFNTGIVDQHGTTNICGLIYGPSFVELENKYGGLQYYSGAIMGGSGVYVEGHADGTTIINFDRSTINRLATQAGKGKGLQLIGWRVRG